jgi:hypothetical protein
MPYKDPAIRKEKQAQYSKAHYERNKQNIIKKINAKKKVHRTWFNNYKSTLKCIQCGYDHPAALDFHHVERKKNNKKVNELVSDGHTKKRILEEIAKCVVLCSNCHRVHHHEERVMLAKQRKSSKIHTSDTCKGKKSGRKPRKNASP